VALNFGTPAERFVDHLTATEAVAISPRGPHFAPVRMAPKIQAILDYLDRVAKQAIVDRPR